MGLNRLVGLTTLKKRAQIDIRAIKMTRETFPNTLLFGLGGIGKTSFARSIANELNYMFVEKEAASFRHRKDIVEFLKESDQRARKAHRRLLLFIDECHRLTVRMQEVFYFPMDELKVDEGKDNWYRMAPFTLFAATTQMDRLDANSFVARFQNVWEMKPFPQVILEQILQQMFDQLRMGCERKGLQKLAAYCGGIPRTADQLSKKVRNHAIAHSRRIATADDVDSVLSMEGLL